MSINQAINGQHQSVQMNIRYDTTI